MFSVLSNIKDWIKRQCPAIASVYYRLTVRRGKQFAGKPVDEVFRKIYDENLFCGTVSVSGPGSDERHTTAIVGELPKLIEKYNVHIFLDAPCGDMYWMANVLSRINVEYCGLDIVEALIEENKKNYSKHENVKFAVADITKDKLPRADLMLCRDCLIHLSNEMALEALRNVKSAGIRYLLTTVFPSTKRNDNIVTGLCRRVNLAIAPFCLPPYLELIAEEPWRSDKSLALYDLNDWNPPN